MKFLTLCKQFLTIYRGPYILKTARGTKSLMSHTFSVKSLLDHSTSACLAYRSYIFRRSLFYKTLSIYSASVYATLLQIGSHMLMKEKI